MSDPAKNAIEVLQRVGGLPLADARRTFEKCNGEEKAALAKCHELTVATLPPDESEESQQKRLTALGKIRDGVRGIVGKYRIKNKNEQAEEKRRKESAAQAEAESS